MKYKNNGFTLIELLAIISILAIILLIAIPSISKIIHKSKVNAAIDSSYSYLKVVEYNLDLNSFASEQNNKIMIIPEDNNLTTGNIDDDIELKKIKIKGQKATFINIQFEDKKIKNAGFCINNISIYYDGEISTESKNDYCNYIVANSLSIDKKLESLIVGNTDKIEVTVFPKNAIISYNSSDSSVATINENGVVTTKKIGTTTITASSGSYSDSYTLNVTPTLEDLVDSLKIIKKSSSLMIGSSDKITVQISPVGATIEYTSSNPSVASIDSDGIVSAKEIGTTTITASSGSYSDSYELEVMPENDGLIMQFINSNYENDTIQKFVSNETEYSVHYYQYDSDQVWDSNMIFGNEDDVATNTSDANNMVVVKVNGDLTIESGVTVTTYGNTYGGPKGFSLIVTGNITNNGTISMSARGAKAIGENVYLYKNIDDTYEHVPAVGAAGKTQASQGSETSSHSYAASGNTASGRQTGGGAPGAARQATGGAGSAGTSYSGGTGGGGANKTAGGAGSANGGTGGAGKTTSSYSHSAGGGAGNAGGAGANGNRSDGRAGANGTGGLLIIYANSLENSGSITSNGSAGGSGYRAGGGGSGGGSINIFYKSNLTSGTISVNGGARGAGTRGAESGSGGIGGTGSITHTKIN